MLINPFIVFVGRFMALGIFMSAKIPRLLIFLTLSKFALIKFLTSKYKLFFLIVELILLLIF